MIVQKYIKGSTAVEIQTSIEAAIRNGSLSADALLPTIRGCAEVLGVSPATISSAYRALRERGLVVTRGRRGTRVSAQPPIHLPTLSSIPMPPSAMDLSVGNPDPNLLPDLAPALSRIKPRQRLYGEDLKDPGLVRMASRALDAESIPSAHLTVVSGALDGLERVMAAHLRPSDPIIVEDPGFSGTLHLIAALGLVPIPVAIDDFGLRPDSLADALAQGAKALVHTPRAQNPTGAALSPERVKELRKVLHTHPDLLVMEDDHAGAVAGSETETLCRGRRHWAIARSYSKALGPDLRVAILVGDAETIARVEGRQQLGIRWVSHVLQQLVAELISEKGMKQRLRRAARCYRERRDALAAALASHEIASSGRSGLNVWIPVPEEASVTSGLRDAGYGVAAGERFRLRSGPAIRVTVAELEPKDAAAFAEALAAILGPSRRARST
jgi:DNA-binding transcriptional MocR family regulator